MASIPPSSRIVIGGLDTHNDLHMEAMLDSTGVVLVLLQAMLARLGSKWSSASMSSARSPSSPTLVGSGRPGVVAVHGRATGRGLPTLGRMACGICWPPTT
jgi:hypothetical protein